MWLRNNILHEHEYGMGGFGMGGMMNTGYMNPFMDMGSRKGTIPTIILISFFFSIGTLGYYTVKGFLSKTLDDAHMFREISTFLPLGTWGLLTESIAKNWNRYFFDDCIPKNSTMICNNDKKKNDSKKNAQTDPTEQTDPTVQTDPTA